MTRVQHTILDIVHHRAPIKGVELAAAVVELHINESFDFHKEVEQLVTEKKLIEVEYILPEQPDRIKSMFFSERTDIQVRGK